jgi:two-component system NtrC family sensor kinase
MSRHLFSFVNNLRIRWKMMVVVMPLVLIPIFLVGAVAGYIGYRQAKLGITQTSKDDLDHLSQFSIDLLDAHYKQFEVYREDKKAIVKTELETLTDLAYRLVEAEYQQTVEKKTDKLTAQAVARETLRKSLVGETGYLYAMRSNGDLVAHLSREGENVFDEQDDEGHYFIRAMSAKAKKSAPGRTLNIIYPWKNPALGEVTPRKKMVAYRYFEPWDWIIAAGGYIEETYDNPAAEQKAFEELKSKLKSKKVGKTGYIYAMSIDGVLTIHPDAEGTSILDMRDADGSQYVRTMVREKEGWIHYDWRNQGEAKSRRKIVRYRYFKPWNWIVAVGSYEDEFYAEANLIKERILMSLSMISLLAALISGFLVFLAAKVLSDPIHNMIGVLREIKRGNYRKQMEVESHDEFGELAQAFNRMTKIVGRNRELEESLAQQGKMASLGVLSSGVAHEINNPLGVILGYAGYLEKKVDPTDPNYRYFSEIKRESKRCKKIVQDLLNYARTPQPDRKPVDLNRLLGQISGFAANHTDMSQVEIVQDFAPDLPKIPVDADQLRQVAINIILNAGSAMAGGGVLQITTRIEGDNVVLTFADSGCGIPEEELEQIFEPFFTTKERGTGLGLAITRQLVEQHRGQISLSSKPGKGTTVQVYLPLTEEDF